MDQKKKVRRLVATGAWGERDAWISIRAGLRCEYCDLDLLESVRNYKEWNKDHIVPKCAGGEDSIENIALACRTCNFSLKSRWNPQERCGEEASREQLINAVRQYIREKQTEVLTQVHQFRKIAFSSDS